MTTDQLQELARLVQQAQEALADVAQFVKRCGGEDTVDAMVLLPPTATPAKHVLDVPTDTSWISTEGLW